MDKRGGKDKIFIFFEIFLQIMLVVLRYFSYLCKRKSFPKRETFFEPVFKKFSKTGNFFIGRKTTTY